MNSEENNALRHTAYRWRIVLTLLLIAALLVATPLMATPLLATKAANTASATESQLLHNATNDVPVFVEDMSNSHSSHEISSHETEISQRHCKSPNCDLTADCAMACTMTCSMNGGCSSSAMVWPTTESSFNATTSTHSSAMFTKPFYISIAPDSLFRPPIN